jgi:hypothetical protein
VRGGISAPRPISTPDPEYTEEARRAKYQVTCVVGLIVDAEGQPGKYPDRAKRGSGFGSEGD